MRTFFVISGTWLLLLGCGPGPGDSSSSSATSTTSTSGSSGSEGHSTSGSGSGSGSSGTTQAPTTGVATTTEGATGATGTSEASGATTGAPGCAMIVGVEDCALLAEFTPELTLEECLVCQGIPCGQDPGCDAEYPCIEGKIVLRGCCTDDQCEGLTPYCGMFIGTDNICVLHDDV